MVRKDSTITVHSLAERYKKLKRTITRHNTPWFKSRTLKMVLVVLMLVSEATALVATITTFNNTLSPLFTAPITIVYCIAFILLAFFQAKALGALLINDESISKERIKLALILNAIAVSMPIAAVGILRWATRELGQSISDTMEQTATFEENAFGIIMILLPVLIYLCEVYLVTAEILYDNRSHELVVTHGQYSELEEILSQMRALSATMPTEEQRREELLRHDEAQFEMAKNFIICIGCETIVQAIEELMKAKKMGAVDVSKLTAEVDAYIDAYKEALNHGKNKIDNEYYSDRDYHSDYDDNHDRLRVG